jgi:hypothetical protein
MHLQKMWALLHVLHIYMFVWLRKSFADKGFAAAPVVSC